MSTSQINIPSYAVDIVCVYDENFNIVFEKARIIKASVKELSKPMDHPLENGTIITDHKIILPTEIELSIIAEAENYRNIYVEIKRLYENSTLLLVQTKTNVHKKMIVVGLPYEESAEMFDAVKIGLRLKEVLYPKKKTKYNPENENQKSVSNNGLQQTSDVINVEQVDIKWN